MKTKTKDPSSAEAESDALTGPSADRELNSLREELVEQKDLNLRLAADLENFKRRSRQEDEVFQQGSRRGAKIFRPAKVAVNDLTHSKQARHAR